MTGLLFTFSLLCTAVVQTDQPFLHGMEVVQLRGTRQSILAVMRAVPVLADAAGKLLPRARGTAPDRQHSVTAQKSSPFQNFPFPATPTHFFHSAHAIRGPTC